MARVLVTGAAGYVGGHVVQQAMQRGDEVVAVDWAQPAQPVEWHAIDIRDYEALAKLVEQTKPTRIYHTAARAYDIGVPLEMMTGNVMATTHILEVARAFAVERAVCASSLSAYGYYPGTPFEEPDHLPVREDHRCRPRDMYSLTKLFGDLLCKCYWDRYQVSGISLRLAAVIGPHVGTFGAGSGGKHWMDFIAGMQAKDVCIPMYSPDEVTHYVDVRDVARAFLLAGESQPASGMTFNVTGPKPTSGAEFRDAVLALVPDAAITFGQWSNAQGRVLYLDNRLARDIFGFEGRYTVADSVRAMWEKASQ
jgi:nucleoside-diphosphate-sugar epimerase